MKKTIDITEALQKLHDANRRKPEPTDEELAAIEVDSSRTIKQVNRFLDYVNEQKALESKTASVKTIPITQEKAANDETPFAEFKLLAAGKKDSTIKWHEQLITVGAINGQGGCLLEITTRAKTNQVNITLSAQRQGEDLLKSLLADYAGGELDINITFKNKLLLDAHLRVAEEADIAQGRGTLYESARPDTKDESVKINIVNKPR